MCIRDSARAVAAQERHDLAREDLEGDPLQGVDVNITRVDIVQSKERPLGLAGDGRGGARGGGHALAPLPRYASMTRGSRRTRSGVPSEIFSPWSRTVP